MIHPTPGRVVWFYPPTNSAESGFVTPGNGEPMAAIVAKVWGDRCVNLTVFDASGNTHGKCSVTLLQDDDTPPEYGDYAAWMPYQKGQAAKADALQSKE
jgi:hypothetical protein